MYKKNVSLLLSILGLGMLVGCVSTKTFRAMEKKYQMADASNKELQSQVVALEGKTELLVESKSKLELEKESMTVGYDELVDSLKQEVAEGNLQVHQYKNMLKVDAADQLFFKSGQVMLRPEGKKVLLSVAKMINENPNKVVRIGGHTDDINPGKAMQARFPTNWEISAARAVNVVRFLQEEGQVSPERLAAVANGQYSPVVANDSKENRAKNRRIEITLLEKEILEEIQKASH